MIHARSVTKLRCHISVSLDGFVAGPNQSEENLLGEGGHELHDWIVPLAAWREAHDKEGGEINLSTRIVEASRANIGAGVMGRQHVRAHRRWRLGRRAVEGLVGRRAALPQRRLRTPDRFDATCTTRWNGTIG